MLSKLQIQLGAEPELESKVSCVSVQSSLVLETGSQGVPGQRRKWQGIRGCQVSDRWQGRALFWFWGGVDFLGMRNGKEGQ